MPKAAATLAPMVAFPAQCVPVRAKVSGKGRDCTERGGTDDGAVNGRIALAGLQLFIVVVSSSSSVLFARVVVIIVVAIDGRCHS